MAPQDYELGMAKPDDADVNLHACVRVDDFDIAAYRRSIGMSQLEFAKFHDISVGTLRQWEQQRAAPLLNRSVKKIFMGWVRQQLSKSGVHVAVS